MRSSEEISFLPPCMPPQTTHHQKNLKKINKQIKSEEREQKKEKRKLKKEQKRTPRCIFLSKRPRHYIYHHLTFYHIRLLYYCRRWRRLLYHLCILYIWGIRPKRHRRKCRMPIWCSVVCVLFIICIYIYINILLVYSFTHGFMFCSSVLFLFILSSSRRGT